MTLPVPAQEVIGEAHILCDQNSYTLVKNGKTITNNHYGSPLNGDALAQAIRVYGHQIFSQYGEVIVRVRGNQHKGMEINGLNTNLTHTVNWGNAGPVRNIKIIGDEPELAAKVGNVNVHNGAGDLLIKRMTIVNSATAYAPFHVQQNGIAGFMCLYNIKFEASDESAWGGTGMKWNIRGHGVARWDLRNVKFHGAYEHNAYVDNCQGDSYFISCNGGNTGRTMLQITNRSQSGPSAFGDVIVKNCESRNVGNQGGSDFTFAGIGPGTLYFFKNRSFGNPAGSQGAFVAWSDAGHGLYLNENGYSTGGVIISDFTVEHPNADRDHIAIAGVEQVILADWHILGHKPSLALNSKFGGGIDNGYVGLYTRNGVLPADAPGWGSGTKVVKYNHVTKQNVQLSDAQINAMQYNRG